MSKPSLITAVLKLRCSHCREGNVFASFWRRNEVCEVCGITFEREPGYFLMGIFFGYVLNAIIFLPITVGLYIAGATLPAYIGIVIAIIVLSPFILRYARVIWLHVDEFLDPR